MRLFVAKLMHNDSSSKDADCYGVVEDGICKKCGEHTPGVVGYSFAVLMRDMLNVKDAIFCTCSQAAGLGIFGLSAAEFNQLDGSARRSARCRSCRSSSRSTPSTATRTRTSTSSAPPARDARCVSPLQVRDYTITDGSTASHMLSSLGWC